jgi:hypothetical protein
MGAKGADMEPILDRLFAETLANRILCMRMWAYLAVESGDGARFVERQRQLSLERVDSWQFEGHRDPEALKRMAKAAINAAWDEVGKGFPSGSPLQ